MESSLYVGLSKQLAVKRQVDLIANNLANSTTPGFKGESMIFTEFVKAGDKRFPISFVQDMGNARDMGQGPLQHTLNPLDVAINGDGWFAIQDGEVERYTRNGHFRLDEQSRLVTSAGKPVLGVGGSPITFEPQDSEIVIDGDGTVTAGGVERGKIRLVEFDDPSTLNKVSGNLFESNAEAKPSTSRVAQGVIEESNVRPVVELTLMLDAMRGYQDAQRLVDEEHKRQRNAIEKLTREA